MAIFFASALNLGCLSLKYIKNMLKVTECQQNMHISIHDNWFLFQIELINPGKCVKAPG